MIPILLALIPYFGWSTGDMFGTLATRKMGGYSTTFWMLCIRVLLSLIYIPFALSELHTLSTSMFLFTLFLGVILITGIVTYTEALKASAASITATISASYSVIVIPLSVIFFHEKITELQVFAILFILIGVFLCTFNLRDLREKKVKFDKSVMLAFTTMLCWGIYFTFLKIPIKEIGWFWPGFISMIVFPVIYLYTKLRGLPLPIPKDPEVFRNVFLFGFLTGISDFSLNAALGTGLTAIVTPIASSSPTMFVLLAFLFLKESITRQQIVGLLTTLSGIVFLAILSV